MTPTQPRLVGYRTRADRSDRADIERVKSAFRGRVWMRRKDLLTQLRADGWPITDDRLREICRYSRGELIGSSSKGYGITRLAESGEVNHVIGEMLSRSRETKERAAEIQSVLNGAGGAR